MTVDPQIAAVLERVNAARPLSSGTPEQGREAFRAMNVLAASAGPRVEVGSVEQTQIPGPAGAIGTRIYRPDGAGPHPTFLFMHGGGFVIGDLDAYDGQCRILCNRVGTVVVSIDYRLAPESPFPDAAEDALAAMEWLAQHVDELGGDAGRIAIGGDSAGGNLSAGVAQAWRGREPTLAAQLLIYPITDFVNEHRPSVVENGEGLFLTRDDMEWFHGHYLGGDDEKRSDPRASPALAEDLSGLPPAIVVTAQYDPLRDDGDAYAAALEAAGVRVIHRRFDGLVHGFFGMGALSGAADYAIDRVCEDLRELLR
jgi:acetyl esterase/lipase